MKLTSKKKVIDWYNQQDQRVQGATFIEQFLGGSSKNKSAVYIKINSRPNIKIIFRVGRRIFDYADVEELDCPYLNIRWFKIKSFK